MTVEIYHHSESVCAQKACVTLEEKGVDWISRYITLEQKEQHTPEYLALNPKAVVPTLVHDGHVITESTAICEYIDEAFEGPSLRPESPYGRAKMRYWTTQIDAGIHAPHCVIVSYVIALRFIAIKAMGSIEAVREKVLMSKNFAIRNAQLESLDRGFESAQFKDSMGFFYTVIQGLNEALDGRDWLVENRFSLADVAYLPYLVRLEDLGLASLWDQHPHVAAFIERLKARPAFDTGFVAWRNADWVVMFDSMRDQYRGEIDAALREVLPSALNRN